MAVIIHFGKVWTNFGQFESFLDNKFGQVSTILNKFGPIWINLCQYGQFWSMLNKFEPIFRTMYWFWYSQTNLDKIDPKYSKLLHKSLQEPLNWQKKMILWNTKTQRRMESRRKILQLDPTRQVWKLKIDSQY